MELEIVLDIGARSCEMDKTPEVRFDARDVLLVYEYESPSGKYKNRAIRFVDTLMCKIANDEIADVWMIDAYDHVAKVVDSELLAKIQKEHPQTRYGRNTAEYHHYIVYFDDIGTYEFIAREAKQDFIET